MASPVQKMVRRMAPWTALLILLGQAARAAEQESGVRGPAADCAVILLADGDYFPALIDGIDGSRREILLSAFLFRTNGSSDHRPDAVLRHLAGAVRRGVRVEVVLEQGPEGDNVSGDNAATAEKLERAGIGVCLDAPGRTTHAKLVVIDGRTLLVGSHNLTQSALKYNREVSVLVDSPELAGQAIRYLRSLCPDRGAAGRSPRPGEGRP